GVGHVDELADLVADGLDDAGRAVAEQVAAPAREEIEVAVALGVPYKGAFAAHQADRVARVVADDKALERVDDLLGRHLSGIERGGTRMGRIRADSIRADRPNPRSSASYCALTKNDFRPHPAVGVYLQEERVPQPAVDHVRLADPGPQTLQAGLDLGDHPLLD